MELIATSVARSEASPERVWSVLIDGLRCRHWSPATEWMLIEGPLEPGTVVTVKRRRARQTAYRIIAAEAPKRLALELTFGPAASMRITWTLEPDGTGTSIRQTIETAGGLRRWLTNPQARRGAVAWNDDPVRLAEIASVGTGEM
jgi:uncharacterized protein YndB with AHSA1/START domain